VVAISELRVAGAGRYFRDRADDVSMVRIPVVEISSYNGALLWPVVSNASNQVVIWLYDQDLNAWKDFLDSTWAIIVGFCVGVPAAVNLGLAVFKLVMLFREYRCTPTVPLTLFLLEIAANFFRVWFGIINFYFRWGFMYLFTTVASTISWPCSLTTTMLISLKWLEVSSSNILGKGQVLSRFRTVFLVASLFVFILEFVSSILRGLHYPIPLLSGISWLILSAVSFVVVALLWFAGAKILRQLNRSIAVHPGDGNPAVAARRQTIALMASGGPLLVVAIFVPVFAATRTVDSGSAFSIAYVSITLACLNIASLIQMLTFRGEHERTRETASSGRSGVGTTEATARAKTQPSPDTTKNDG
jgi:hypothetical protein